MPMFPGEQALPEYQGTDATVRELGRSRQHGHLLKCLLPCGTPSPPPRPMVPGPLTSSHPAPPLQAGSPRCGATSSPQCTSSTQPPLPPWTLALWPGRQTCRCGRSASAWCPWWRSGRRMRVARQASGYRERARPLGGTHGAQMASQLLRHVTSPGSGPKQAPAALGNPRRCLGPPSPAFLLRPATKRRPQVWRRTLHL